VVGRTQGHHGWANPGNREEPALGLRRIGRSAARRVSQSRKGLRGTFRKGRRSRPSSLRGSESFGFGCPHVEVQLQKSIGDVLVPNKLGKRAPKSAAGSSERGPSSERRSAGETAGRRIERRATSGVGLTGVRRARIGARLRVMRDCHPAVTTSPKAVRWSRDRGCNGHRIL
jgi:hypothetical protein